MHDSFNFISVTAIWCKGDFKKFKYELQRFFELYFDYIIFSNIVKTKCTVLISRLCKLLDNKNLAYNCKSGICLEDNVKGPYFAC